MKKIISIFLALATVPALAHPGHGNESPLSPGHFVTNPEHAIPITLAVASAIVLITWLASRRERTSK